MKALKNIIQKLSKKQPVIGTHISFGDSSITELLGDIGFDFIWIDTEHAPLDKKDTQLHIIAARSTGAAAFIRVQWNDPVIVKPILEMGPDGIIFPMIKTAEEAEKAVRSCLYPPDGIRSYGPRRANKYGMIENQKYINLSGSSIWKIMQIEHVEAVKNLEEILQVEGVDAIVIGSQDLSGSVGLLGQTTHRDVLKLMDEIGIKASKCCKPFGISMGDDPDVMRAWMKRGVNWLAVGNDYGFIVKSAKAAYLNAKEIFTDFRGK